MNTQSLFAGRKMLVASKHHKEEAIAPILEALGCEVIAFRDFDTDTLGTFSGEVERTLTPIEAAEQKCNQVHQLAKADLVIANEGSFGPHPEMPFVPGDEEFLILRDYLHDRTYIARSVSFDTNFAGKDIGDMIELDQFLSEIQFPSHAVIIKPSKERFTDMLKGVDDVGILKHHFDRLLSLNKKAYIETDMRAMYNPSRMKVIAETAKKLVELIKTTCPECHAPGYQQVGVIPGLPCSWCGQATNSTLSHEWKCDVCGFSEVKVRTDKTEEDPMYCQYCNP